MSWKEEKLGKLLTFQRGYDITKKMLVDGPYVVISSSGEMGMHIDFKVKGPGVVIGRKGSLGTVFYSEKDYWPSDTTLWIKDFHGNDPKFAYYFLKTMKLEKLDVGAANPTLNRNHIHTLTVKYPEIALQETIASILTSYDDLIENNHRRIQLLEEMARAIYREWFVYFRFPGHEEVEMVDSELGEIPEGWRVKKLKDVVELVYGKGLRKKDRIEGAFPVYGSSGIIDYHQEKMVDGPGIIVGRKGNPGKVHWSQIGFYPIDTTFYVSTDVSLYYVYYHLDEMKFVDTHTAVPGLSRDSAYLKNFLVPQNNIVESFQDIVCPIFELRYNLELQNKSLQRMKDLLLPQLISGEIDVSELNIEISTSNMHKTPKYEDAQSDLTQWLDGDEEDGRRQ